MQLKITHDDLLYTYEIASKFNVANIKLAYQHAHYRKGRNSIYYPQLFDLPI
jgi:hypothetical protein